MLRFLYQLAGGLPTASAPVSDNAESKKATSAQNGVAATQLEKGRPTAEYLTAVSCSTRLPAELSLQILDEAQVWCTIKDPNLGLPQAHGRPKMSVHKNRLSSAETSVLTRWGAENVRGLNFFITSRDQGWSDTRQFHGTYEGSYTWHEAAVVMPASESSEEVTLYSTELQRNVHAGKAFKDYEINWTRDHEIFQHIQPGCVIKIISCAMYSGWVNHIRTARIELQFRETFGDDLPDAFEKIVYVFRSAPSNDSNEARQAYFSDNYTR